jgi:hypothetical protein
MEKRDSGKVYPSIDAVVKEYKRAYTHNNRYLDGFGKFTVIDSIGSIKREKRESSHDPKFHSDSALDTKLGQNYFSALANQIKDMINSGEINLQRLFGPPAPQEDQ